MITGIIFLLFGGFLFFIYNRNKNKYIKYLYQILSGFGIILLTGNLTGFINNSEKIQVETCLAETNLILFKFLQLKYKLLSLSNVIEVG